MLFFASLSPPALMIELLLVFGGFERKKQARSVPESDGFCQRSVFLRTSTSVLCGERPKAHSCLKASNLPTLVESSIGLTMTVQVSALANAF